MKRLLIAIIIALPLWLKAQSFPPNNPNECFEKPLGSISPWNWTNEYKDGSPIPSNLNFADWWETYPRYNDGGTAPYRELRVPFITANQINLTGIYVAGEFQQALANADYHPEDGWVLLDFDFGLAEGSQTIPNGKVNPYLVLYNKYTSVLRVFFFMTQMLQGVSQGQSNLPAARITLQYGPDEAANSLPSIFQAAESPVKPVDFLVDVPGGENEHAFLAMNVFNQAQSSTDVWYYADFPITYDPGV